MEETGLEAVRALEQGLKEAVQASALEPTLEETALEAVRHCALALQAKLGLSQALSEA